MTYVELHRSFAKIDKDSELSPDIAHILGRRAAGWLTWPDLLQSRRVVLLAEAGSGKTEEFRHQAEQLRSEGRAAFFLPIEELADADLEVTSVKLV